MNTATNTATQLLLPAPKTASVQVTTPALEAAKTLAKKAAKSNKGLDAANKARAKVARAKKAIQRKIDMKTRCLIVATRGAEVIVSSRKTIECARTRAFLEYSGFQTRLIYKAKELTVAEGKADRKQLLESYVSKGKQALKIEDLKRNLNMKLVPQFMESNPERFID